MAILGNQNLQKLFLLKYVPNAESLFTCTKRMLEKQNNRIIWIVNVILRSLVLTTTFESTPSLWDGAFGLF